MTRISSFRNYLAGATVAALVCGTAAGSLAQPSRPAMTGLKAAARRNHLRFYSRSGAVYVHLAGCDLRFAPLDAVVRCGNIDIYHLQVLPRVAKGDLLVAADDVQRLLLLDDTGVAGDPPQTFERLIVRTQTPPPNAALAATRGPIVDDADPSRDYVMLRLSFMNQGSQTRELALDGGGQTIRGAMTVDDYSGVQNWTYGVLEVGSQARFLQYGEQLDSLAGVTFRPSRSLGASYNDVPDGTQVFDVLRNGMRRFTGIKHTHGRRTLTLAGVMENGHVSGALAGVSDRFSNAQGTFTREVWLGSRGAAIGVSTQTAGRFFYESWQSVATRDFPVDAGDLPLRQDVGYRFSPAFTLRAGVASAYGVHASDYFNATLNTRNSSLLATVSAAETALGLTTHDDTGYVTFALSSAPGLREWRVDGARALGNGQLQLTGWSLDTGDSDTALEWRTTRSSAALVVGVESVREGATRAAGPIVGVSFPIDRDLAAQLETRPMANGSGLRVSFAQRINVAIPHRAPATLVRVLGDARGPLRYVVDDSTVASSQARSATLRIPNGTHTVVVQTVDGAYASLPAEVESGARTVTLALYPVKVVTGRVIVDDPADFVVPPQLDGITVDLLPGTAVTTTDPSGSFTFPPAPIAPHSAAQLVEESLPDELIADGPLNIDGNGIMLLHVRAKRRIEKVHFGNSSP